ncbi:restriction endonuclease subunit S [Methylocaldum sp.]|uniref:restriction endonuclease subunit S n=1 Tax=Methylocaldum sp. TaxID=1969727 RepID=UPI002D5B9D05|nr:restriction endonuclease subunit S [Methylocaldum sp.]HYE37085.1 restriction endonuclease subunit S [Methylocaldum sp.]
MAGEWATSVFVDAPIQIIDGDRGANYPKQSEFLSNGHCLFLNAGNVTTTGFDFSDCAFISEEKDTDLRKGKLQRQDVVLTTRGTVGNAAYFDEAVLFENIRINSGMVIFRPDPSALLPRFLYLFVRSAAFLDQVARLRTGSAQPQLPIRDINRIKIPIPPLPEQRAIAHILGTLDDKIELNRRMNATLEAMARAIFKSWFVDFDPVRAKTEGRAPEGLNPAIAALFPDGFEDSELGEIPAGWRVQTLGEVTQYLSRGISPAYVEHGGVLVLNQKCIRDGSVDSTKGRRHDSTKKSINGRGLIEGDVLVNSTGVGTLGRVAQILAVEEETIVDSHVTVVRADGINLSWNYLGIDLSRRQDEIEALGEGSTGQTELARARLAGLPVLIPEQSVIAAFDKIALPFRYRRLKNECESRTLAALRDTLLPKLLSGELRVKNAERFIEVGT